MSAIAVCGCKTPIHSPDWCQGCGDLIPRDGALEAAERALDEAKGLLAEAGDVLVDLRAPFLGSYRAGRMDMRTIAVVQGIDAFLAEHPAPSEREQ